MKKLKPQGDGTFVCDEGRVWTSIPKRTMVKKTKTSDSYPRRSSRRNPDETFGLLPGYTPDGDLTPVEFSTRL